MVDTLTTSQVASIAEPMNLFETLALQADTRPHKEALVHETERMTYSDLMSRAAAIGLQLKKVGVKRADRVAVLFPNHPDYVASFFAVAGLGATIVPVNPLLRSEEIAHILSDSGAETLIVFETAVGEALKSQDVVPSLKFMLVSGLSDTTTAPVNKHNIVIQKLTSDKVDPKRFPRELAVDPDRDLAMLVYTSGTTGKPKGAMLTHGNILAVFPRRLDLLEIDDRDRVLAVLPMCHIYGITVLMIGTLSTGGTLVVLPRFEAAAALELIAKERVTIIPAVPAMHRFVLMELANRSYDVSSVRMCMSGGSALPTELISELETALGAACVEGYALTETSCAATLNPLRGKRKPGSVGPALESIELRILGADGQSLPSGEENIGEVQIRGANIMRGYYNQPQATADVIDSKGWFSTGDLGYKDADGYLYLVGRKKEMIIRGGQNIYPREIEDVIGRIPGVVESAVIGIPDKFMGERVKAIVVTSKTSNVVPTEEQIKSFCAEHLAEYKVPRIVEFADTLPRNSTGKILKRLLS
ncbi:MAG: AMP-binding protein [Candidatus Obscuribacterales bacterium]|nr:AMP-binding protein [Candidatus Obscuribacterales bacterium]